MDSKASAGKEPESAPSVRYLDPDEVRVHRGDDGRVCVTIGDELTVLGARFLRAYPLTDPDRHLAIFASGGSEDFGLLRDWRRLDRESREIVAAELERRYLHPVVKRIQSVEDFFGAAICVFETDRGVREVTLREIRDTTTYLDPGRILLTDAEGNRYDIPDVASLDAASRALLARIL